MDYETLEALVEPIEEDVKRQVTVLLTDLYPLVRQENEAVNVEATHIALQKIRFFQNQLSFPWDSELFQEPSSQSWNPLQRKLLK